MENLRHTFKLIDINGDGVISRHEIKELLLLLGDHVTEEGIDELMRLSDPNCDGYVDFEEFVRGATAMYK